MKSLIALLTALVMAFSCIGLAGAEAPAFPGAEDIGLAARAKIEGPLTLEAAINLDKDALMALPGVTEENRQQIETMADVLNILKLKAVKNGSAVQVSLTAEDEPVYSLAARRDAQGFTVAGTLLGNNAIRIDQAKLREMIRRVVDEYMRKNPRLRELLDAIRGLNAEKAFQAVFTGLMGLSFRLQGKIGEPESGTFEVEGRTFTSKIPINMTYEELNEIVLTFIKDILTDDAFAPLMKAAAGDRDIGAAIDKRIEAVKNLPEDQKYTLEGAVYGNEAGETCVVLDLFRDGADGRKEYFHLTGLQAEGDIRLTVKSENMDGMDSADMTISILKDQKAEAEGTFVQKGLTATLQVHGEPTFTESTVTVKGEGVDLKEHAVMRMSEDSVDYTLDYFYGGMDKAFMTFAFKVYRGGEITERFDGEDLRVIPFEKLIGSENSGERGALLLTVSAQIINGMDVIKAHLPEETRNVLNNLIVQGQ